MCNGCWWIRTQGERVPHRIQPPQVERCSYCGVDTSSGIYVRDHPDDVLYPALEEDP